MEKINRVSYNSQTGYLTFALPIVNKNYERVTFEECNLQV